MSLIKKNPPPDAARSGFATGFKYSLFALGIGLAVWTLISCVVIVRQDGLPGWNELFSR